MSNCRNEILLELDGGVDGTETCTGHISEWWGGVNRDEGCCRRLLVGVILV